MEQYQIHKFLVSNDIDNRHEVIQVATTNGTCTPEELVQEVATEIRGFGSGTVYYQIEDKY